MHWLWSWEYPIVTSVSDTGSAVCVKTTPAMAFDSVDLPLLQGCWTHW